MAGRKKGTVGVVGLGIMGGAFARNLAESGWRVFGYDIDPARRRALAKVGVEVSPDVATLARTVPVIITSLPSPQALDAVVGDITGTKLPPRVVIEASTLTLVDKFRAERALTKAGYVPLDCPVGGTGASEGCGDLGERRKEDDREAQALVSRLSPRHPRSRRVRQRQPDEIRRQPAGRDPQRGERGEIGRASCRE